MNTYIGFIILFLFIFFLLSIFLIFVMKEGKIMDRKYRGNTNFNYDKVMIVAHPDDEVLWGGLHLVKENGWKVISVTNGNNIIRRNEFINVMNDIKSNYEIWSYEDQLYGYNMNKEIYKDIKNIINDPKIKFIVTHNVNGEYGHIQHKKVHQVVTSQSNKPVYVFSYNNKKINKNLKDSHLYKLKKKISENYLSQKNIIRGHINKNIEEKFLLVN